MAESRRSFLKQSVATVAAASVAGCAPDAGRRPAAEAGGSPAPLPAGTLRAVAEAVLPAELGDEGRERAVAAFERWSEGLEPVAELSHPYLVPEIRYSGPDPRPGWAAQLEGLDKECRSRHGVSLAAIDMPERRKMLERPLGQAGPSLGLPGKRGPHRGRTDGALLRVSGRDRPVPWAGHREAAVPGAGGGGCGTRDAGMAGGAP